MKLSEMRALLEEHGIQLTKSLGQNFLHDGNQLRRIVDAAELTPSDRVLEIGPGLGPLTGQLLAKAGEVLAIEKDGRLVELLKRRFPEARNLTLLHADALEYLREPDHDWSGWKVVANLPYSVGSPILVELALAPRRPHSMAVTLQQEVVRRLAAHVGDADYGVLTLLVQLHYEPRGWFRIPASCFFPEPDVESACIALMQRSGPAMEFARAGTYIRLVKLAFSQRRKMMLKLLKQQWPEPRLRAAYEPLGLDPRCRAEAVSREQFVELAGILQDSGARANPAARSKDYRTMSDEMFDVVNERDEVIGQRPRTEVHRLGLKHRAVHVLVFNRRGELFLQKRSMKKDNHPGVWDSSASGHLDAGEDYDTAALRELEEELGWRAQAPLERLFKIAACAATGQEFVWVYRLQAAGPFTLHPEEIDQGEWFAPEQLTSWLAQRIEDFAPTFPWIWRQYRQG